MNIETADRLIMLRKRKGLSQEELAEALGISRQAVSKWERAESSPDMDNAIQLSRLYNISLDELFGNKPEYEIELDRMEPDLPEEAVEPNAADAADIIDASYESIEELSASAPEHPSESLSSMISEIVHDAVSAAHEAAREARRPSREAAGGSVGRELVIPAGAETIGNANYEGIRRLVCSVRADLSITGTESDICSVYCDGPERERSRCFVYTVGDTLHIDSADAKRRLFFDLQGRVRLAISVVLPKALSVEADLKGGDLDLSRVRSDLMRGRTGGGDINAKECAFDSLELKTGGGDIAIASTHAQRAELVTGGGDINVDRLKASALLSARTGGGDMYILGSAKCVEATTGGGDIKLEVKAEGIKASSGGGDITIRSAHVKYVNAKTGGGDIKATLGCCTGVTADLASAGGEASFDYMNEKHSTGRKLNITEGDGSTVLEMRSGGGDIAVVAE